MNATAIMEKIPDTGMFDEIGMQKTFDTNPVYEDEMPKLGGIESPDETDQVRKIKRLYRMDGAEIDDTQENLDDEEERRRKEAIFLPSYQKQETKETPNNPKTAKPEKPNYTAKNMTPDVVPAKHFSRSEYVCMPGSKGACGTCPVYSLIASSAARLSGGIASEQVLGGSYLAGRSTPKTLMNSFLRSELTTVR